MSEEFELGYVPEKIDERTEVELRTVFNEAARALGPEKLRELMIAVLLPHEESIRKEGKPDSPAIQLLNEYHAEKQRGEQGFE